MAKKIRMTFTTERKSANGDYTLKDEISVVDDAEKFMTMFDVAAYLMEHIEGFTSYIVTPVKEEEKEGE